MNTVAIIPARGGSKRIPGKNIKIFAGYPMISYSITAARESGVFNRIIVSTDDDEIANVARSCGAEVPFRRPAHLADDRASTEDVLVNALETLRENGETFEHACCIYATAPFIDAKDLPTGFDALRRANATTAFAVTTFEYPIFRAFRIRPDGRLEMLWPEHRDARSQELPEACHDAGQFYWLDVKKFLVERQLFSADSVPVHIPRWRVQDIDTPEDWRRAEMMFKAAGRS
jgi:N-acylneuraminate cytidylyltransferase